MQFHLSIPLDHVTNSQLANGTILAPLPFIPHSYSTQKGPREDLEKEIDLQRQT